MFKAEIRVLSFNGLIGRYGYTKHALAKVTVVAVWDNNIDDSHMLQSSDDRVTS